MAEGRVIIHLSLRLFAATISHHAKAYFTWGTFYMGQKDVSVVVTSKLLWTSKRKRETDVFTERDQSDRKKLIFKICAQTHTYNIFLIYYISDNTHFNYIKHEFYWFIF